jgi:uncharacterized protein (TIGR04255 family)
MDGIPLRLNKDPIVEALVELRFRGAGGVPISDLLPGMLFPKVRDRFPTIASLPISQLPREIRLRDPNLLYKPCHKLDGGQFVIAIGERVFTVSCVRPYVGWKNSEREILDLYGLLGETEIISEIERFSIKIALLDNIHSIDLEQFLDLDPAKLLTLSQYGFYVFLVKLSIHFTRFQEGVLRF